MKFGIRTLFVAGAAVVFMASPAQADIIDFTGSTTGAPGYNRTLEDLSALSAVGTNVRYRTVTLNVSVSGTYTFLSTGQFDNFSFLYQGTFNPNTPLINAIAGNDDLLGLTTSGFAADLIAGADYVFVTTAFANADFGAFSDTIGGPGAVTATLVAASPSDILTFTGNTTAAPTFNRPLEDLSGLSVVGTDVAYNTFEFDVTVSGKYTFLTTAGFDSFDFLYANSFDPNSPLINGLIGNDDLLGLTTSGFAANLIAGTHYLLVTTGFANDDFGYFSNTIGGPGPIVTDTNGVPEPQTLLLLGLGLAAIAFARRYQKT